MSPAPCRCEHAASQHRVRVGGTARLCDYSGFSCACDGYKPKARVIDQTAPRLPTRDTLALLVRVAKRAGNCIRAAKGNEMSLHGDDAVRASHHSLARTMYLEAEADLRQLESVARAAGDDLKRYRAMLRLPGCGA